MIEDVLIPAFWQTATQLGSLIVPITAITIAMRLFLNALYGGRRD